MVQEEKWVMEQPEDANALLAELHRRNQELNTFLETAQIGLHRVGPDGTILWANSAEMEMLGYRPEEYIGHHIGEFHADETAINEVLGTLGRGDKLYEYEARLRCKDGSIKHVLIDSSVLWDDGRFVHTQCFTRDITRRRRADDELREAKLRAEQILDRITDGFIALDNQWRLTYINRYAAEVYGRIRPAGELLWKVIWEEFPGLIGSVAEKEYRRAMAEQVTTKFEMHYEPLRGWFEVTAYPSREGLSVYFKEITARKKLEQSLRENQQLLQGIINNSPAVIYAKDLEGRYLLANRRYPELFHIDPDWVLGKTDFEIFSREQAESFRAMDQRVLQAGHALTEEEVVPLDDGSHTFISVKCPLRDEHGKAYAIFGISTDITHRKRAEETLRESEERFRTLADNIAQLAWMADGKGSIFWYNQRWFEYTGTTLDEMEGWGWQKVHHPDHVQRVVAKIRQAFETGEYWEDTFPLRGKDGQYRWFLSRGVPIRDAQGKVLRWLGTNTDITEHKQLEAALAKAHEELAHHARDLETMVAERTAHLEATIAELEGVSYSLSHDMRAPLRTIQSFSEIVLEEAGENISPTARELLRKSILAAQRLDRLIRDVLIYSRVSRESIEFKTLDVEHLIRQIIDERPEFQKPRAIIRMDLPLKPVRGHEAYLSQCITNLLDNAVKFVPPERTPEVRIWSQTIDGQVRLWFEDNGIGIAKEAQERVFGIFQRVHAESSYPGTGIGLAIVRKAVERMGGTAGLESEPGRGSRFWLQLSAGEPTHDQ
jgi:PAS domain S-box-containing protein